jgi:hypothetical protein
LTLQEATEQEFGALHASRCVILMGPNVALSWILKRCSPSRWTSPIDASRWTSPITLDLPCCLVVGPQIGEGLGPSRWTSPIDAIKKRVVLWQCRKVASFVANNAPSFQVLNPKVSSPTTRFISGRLKMTDHLLEGHRLFQGLPVGARWRRRTIETCPSTHPLPSHSSATDDLEGD